MPYGRDIYYFGMIWQYSVPFKGYILRYEDQDKIQDTNNRKVNP